MRTYTFGPEKRVKKRKEFLVIQNSPTKARSRNLLFTCVHKDKGSHRIGITVSKKVNKLAVERNLIKRRIREVYRKLYPFLLGKADVVVIAFKESQELSYLDIKSEMNHGLRRLGLLGQRKSKVMPAGKKEEYTK